MLVPHPIRTNELIWPDAVRATDQFAQCHERDVHATAIQLQPPDVKAPEGAEIAAGRSRSFS